MTQILDSSLACELRRALNGPVRDVDHVHTIGTSVHDVRPRLRFLHDVPATRRPRAQEWLPLDRVMNKFLFRRLMVFLVACAQTACVAVGRPVAKPTPDWVPERRALVAVDADVPPAAILAVDGTALEALPGSERLYDDQHRPESSGLVAVWLTAGRHNLVVRYVARSGSGARVPDQGLTVTVRTGYTYLLHAEPESGSTGDIEFSLVEYQRILALDCIPGVLVDRLGGRSSYEVSPFEIGACLRGERYPGWASQVATDLRSNVVVSGAR